MNLKELKEKISDIFEKNFSGELIDFSDFRDELTIVVKKEKIKLICEFLKQNPDFNFVFLTDLTAIDHLLHDKKPRFEVVYHLYSLNHKHRLRIKCPVDEESLHIDSVTSVWKTADFLEREVFDMFGIIFDGHPNLTRILMPDDWQGYPLRKDFPLGGVKSFYYKRDTQSHIGEPPNLVPRIRVQEEDV